MGIFLYNFFVRAYFLSIHIAALFNPKARRWVSGRRDYRSSIPELLRTIPSFESKKRVWMHCASLGEFEQGRPVLEALRQEYPGTVILLSFFSPSGYEAVKDYRGADAVFYLPEDNRSNARWLIGALDPELVLWVKYEFWFHFINEIRVKKIPLMLLSSLFRKGQPFFKPYGSIWRSMLKAFSFFFVQNEESAALLAGLGIRSVSVCGDTRFDRVLEIAGKHEPISGVAEFCGAEQVLVAGSTWPEDEQILKQYFSVEASGLLIVAPHETDKGRISQLLKTFPEAVLYSQLAGTPKRVEQKTMGRVLIIDRMGLLSRLYRYGQIAYVGGGFNRGGIHNVLEPAVYGMPVIFGPVFQKFTEAVDMVKRGSGISVRNPSELRKVLDVLWNNPQLLREKSEDAADFVKSRSGATRAILDQLAANRLLTS